MSTRDRTASRRSTAKGRYQIRFSIGMVLYAVTLIAAIVLHNAGLTGPVAWLPGVLTFPSIGVLTWALVAYYRESDEFEQRKLGESFVFAFAVGVPAILVVGLLQTFGLSQLNWMVAFVIMMAAWLLGSVIASARYR